MDGFVGKVWHEISSCSVATSWFYLVWLTVQTVPLFKSSDHETVRPLGLRNILVKSFHREVGKGNREVMRSYLEPQQLVLSTAGASKLVFSIRQPLETSKDFVCRKLDIRNETSRAETIKVLSEEPSLHHLASFAAATLAPASGDYGWGRIDEGGTQGDPITWDLFRVTFQLTVVTEQGV